MGNVAQEVVFMAPQRLNISALNNADQLSAMYDKLTIPEIAECLGCSINTVRGRMQEFGIKTRNGATSSVQTRMEKATMAIRLALDGFDSPSQAIILGPFVAKLKAYGVETPPCPICNRVDGHLYWCSIAQPHKAIMED
jgi:hypothetical protein